MPSMISIISFLNPVLEKEPLMDRFPEYSDPAPLPSKTPSPTDPVIVPPSLELPLPTQPKVWLERGISKDHPNAVEGVLKKISGLKIPDLTVAELLSISPSVAEGMKKWVSWQRVEIGPDELKVSSGTLMKDWWNRSSFWFKSLFLSSWIFTMFSWWLIQSSFSTCQFWVPTKLNFGCNGLQAQYQSKGQLQLCFSWNWESILWVGGYCWGFSSFNWSKYCWNLSLLDHSFGRSYDFGLSFLNRLWGHPDFFWLSWGENSSSWCWW